MGAKDKEAAKNGMPEGKDGKHEAGKKHPKASGKHGGRSSSRHGKK